MKSQDIGIVHGKCNGKGCQECGGRGRLFSLISDFEREGLIKIVNKALEDKVSVKINLTRAIY